jgi:tuftelin-interacting protein 11
MARRKRGFMDDGISDSSGGSDDEIADDDDPYQRKKRRRNGDEDSEDEGFGGRSKPAVRHDWAKAPAFVSSKTTGSKPDLDQSEVMDIPDVVVGREARDSGSESSGDSAEDEDDQEEVDADGSDDDNDDDDDDDDSDEDQEVTEPPEVPPPRVQNDMDEEELQRPRFGGLGLGASSSRPPTTFSGFSRSGIGASRPAAVSIPATPSPAPSPSPAPPVSEDVTIPSSLPSAFGGSSRPQRAFVRNSTPSAPQPSKPNLSAAESAHFRNLGTSFGARMLAKMGWESGTGLGAEGRGIVVPIETKLRPKNMGIAFKGFGERTEQSKAEARRRGEVVSDDEDEERKKKASKAKEKSKKGSDAWKKSKKVKTKIEHKTYEQIVAEVGEDVAGPSGLGVIIDATGATVSILLSIDIWQIAYSLFPATGGLIFSGGVYGVMDALHRLYSLTGNST